MSVASLTWSTLQTTIQAIIARTPAPWTVSDPAFNALFPQATAYAESRIYNEMPMLAQRAQDKTLLTTPGSRSISLVGTALPIVVPERIALLSPLTTYLVDGYGKVVVDGYGNPIVASSAAAVQTQYIPTSLDFIEMYWPNEAVTAAPTAALAPYWCISGGVDSDYSSPTIIVAPTPDAAYTVVVTGLFQQAPISATNPQTYLSTVYAPLFLSACMVFISGALLRNYSSAGNPLQPDDAGMSVHWEGQFRTLLESAKAEELRRRAQGAVSFTSPPVSPGAHPPARTAA